jgi:transcriptional regulator
MYIPEKFKIEDEQLIHQFIQTNPFATVISTINDKVQATHMPIDQFQNGNYYGHIAKHNPQSNISDSQEVLVIFTGPHAYITNDVRFRHNSSYMEL